MLVDRLKDEVRILVERPLTGPTISDILVALSELTAMEGAIIKMKDIPGLRQSATAAATRTLR